MRTPVPAIDIHTHLFPERLSAAVRRALGSMYGWTFSLPDEPNAFAAFERAHGVERFVILPYAHKPGMARSLNDWVIETAATLEGAIPFACVNQHDEDAVELLTDAFDAGARGIKLHHHVQDVAPDDLSLDRIYDLMLERDMPILAHAGRGPTDNGLVGADRVQSTLRARPHLRLCIAHMGAPEFHEFLALLPDHPNLYLDTSGLGSLSLLEFDVASVRDRIVWGSDAPNIPFDYDIGITRITDLGLGSDAEEMIFRSNAERFLRLPRNGTLLDKEAERMEKVVKTDQEWRAQLTDAEYDVLRNKGTERPFSGEYVDTTTPGIYRCQACGHELFRSETKFDAHCGWPSFTAPMADDAVDHSVDTSHFMVRTEVTCSNCGSHLGHVFDDGPGPTGKRYCINSVSLTLQPGSVQES